MKYSNLTEGTLKKGDSFNIGDRSATMMAKMIASKYNVNPEDFINNKKGVLTYSPKRTSKPKREVISKPENMSVEEYKTKLVIPLKPELKDEENEEWRPVPNKGRYFGGEADYSNYYEISNLGRLRTINLQDAAKSSISTGYDAPTRNAMQFHLNHKSGMNTCPDVKYMVADAFLGEHDLEDNMVIHIDGDYHNNRADNLKWVPRKRKKDNNSNVEEEMVNEIIKQSIRKLQSENKSGININPENKGKFNATKERTGKSTEELTHSKNPLTRKRAIFAQNAAKWKHKKVNESCGVNEDVFIQIAEECGWDFDDCFEVQNPTTGEKGTRFVFRNSADSCGEETFKSKIMNAVPSNCKVIFSKGTHRYAPELTNFSFVLICNEEENLNENEGEEMNITNANNNRISVEDILKRINDAGVNQAMPNNGTQNGVQNSTAGSSSYEFHLGSYIYNAAQHKLSGPNGSSYLSARQSDLLQVLCEHMNQTVDRGTVLKALWRNEDGFSSRSMDVYINSLRKLFADDPNVNIYNVRGVGFRLEVK